MMSNAAKNNIYDILASLHLLTKEKIFS